MSVGQKGDVWLAKRRSGGEHGRELSRKEERQQRILDAAAELFQKWGYRKTTLADIAKQARVAKGTIYLYWKTREELLMALMSREEKRLIAEIEQRVAADPDGLTMPGLVKHSMLASLQNPWMKAVLLQDTEVLGELASSEYSKTTYQASIQGYLALLTFLRERGLIRDDVDLRQQVFILTAVAWGFLLVRPLMPEEFQFSDEESVEIMARTLKRVLEPDEPPTDEERREGGKAFKTFMDQMTELFKQDSGESEAELS